MANVEIERDTTVTITLGERGARELTALLGLMTTGDDVVLPLLWEQLHDEFEDACGEYSIWINPPFNDRQRVSPSLEKKDG